MAKAMNAVKGQGQTVGSTTNRFTSFCFPSIGHVIPEIQLFKKLTLKIQGQGHGQGQTHWSHLRHSVESIRSSEMSE